MLCLSQLNYLKQGEGIKKYEKNKSNKSNSGTRWR